MHYSHLSDFIKPYQEKITKWIFDLIFPFLAGGTPVWYWCGLNPNHCGNNIVPNYLFSLPHFAM